jgi:hypothetical protein
MLGNGVYPSKWRPHKCKKIRPFGATFFPFKGMAPKSTFTGEKRCRAAFARNGKIGTLGGAIYLGAGKGCGSGGCGIQWVAGNAKKIVPTAANSHATARLVKPLNCAANAKT